jgi:hypothetical protein
VKTCTKCGLTKDLNCFQKHKGTKDGFYSWCKECVSIKSKLFYKNNKLEEIKRNSLWAKNNPEKNRNKYKRWTINNPEKTKERHKKYYKKNKEKIREYSLKNKEKISLAKSIYRRTEKGKAVHKNAKFKRKSKMIETDITSDFLLQLKEETKLCSICGKKMNDLNKHPQQYNLDHITPIGIGGTHTKNNVRYICRKCNLERPRK